MVYCVAGLVGGEQTWGREEATVVSWEPASDVLDSSITLTASRQEYMHPASVLLP